MIKFAFIGAGSFTFGKKLITDLLSFPHFQKEIVISLEDIDLYKLDSLYSFLQKYKESNHAILENVIFKKTQDQKKAVKNAKYVINLTQIGGLEAYKLDLEIPKKYGVSQCIGDTIGPGGVFRFLRSAPFLKELILQIQTNGYSEQNVDKSPILFNYSNPMGMNTWYCNSIEKNSTIGLCHGVTNTAQEIQSAINVKPENFKYLCAGINHMAWFLSLQYRDNPKDLNLWKNAYPLLYKAISDDNTLLKNDKIRIDMMNATGGYFMTESSGHLSEYLPYYRKRKDLLEKYRGEIYLDKLDHGIYFQKMVELSQVHNINFISSNPYSFKTDPSNEDFAHIINAFETNSKYLFNGNIMNEEGKFITNLPKNSCVEVPITIKDGYHPKMNIELPTVCAALCTSNIFVQKLAVQAVLSKDIEKVYHAILLDPNTASVCSPSEIREMVNEMFEAQARWISDF